MKVYVFSNENELVKIKKRLRKSVYIVGHYDLTSSVNYNFSDFKDIKVDICIMASKEQKCAYDKMGLSFNYITFSDFEKTYFLDPTTAFNNKMQYTSLLMGMSHLQCAVAGSGIKNRKCCNLAHPSMDLFLHYKFFEKLSKDNKKSFEHIETVILEMPYYIFNYDLSRFNKFIYTKLKYFEIINDYHNFGKTEFEKQKIDEYKIFMQCFEQEEKILDTKKISKLRKILKRIYYQLLIAKNHDSVWYKQYHETIKENEIYFEKLVKLVKQRCPNAKFKVLIMPFNPIFRWTHKKQIDISKEIFYNIISKYNIDIVDHFSYFNSSKWFNDHCHLNEKGAEKYTSILMNYLS